MKITESDLRQIVVEELHLYLVERRNEESSTNEELEESKLFKGMLVGGFLALTALMHQTSQYSAQKSAESAQAAEEIRAQLASDANQFKELKTMITTNSAAWIWSTNPNDESVVFFPTTTVKNTTVQVLPASWSIALEVAKDKRAALAGNPNPRYSPPTIEEMKRIKSKTKDLDERLRRNVVAVENAEKFLGQFQESLVYSGIHSTLAPMVAVPAKVLLSGGLDESYIIYENGMTPKELYISLYYDKFLGEQEANWWAERLLGTSPFIPGMSKKTVDDPKTLKILKKD